MSATQCLTQKTDISGKTVARGASRNWRRFARVVIYSHLLAVLICGLLSYLDRHGGFEWLPGLAAGMLCFPAVAALYVCPVLILVVVLNGRFRFIEAATICCAEFALELGHVVAILPLVQ
jgi:hypothetical protein